MMQLSARNIALAAAYLCVAVAAQLVRELVYLALLRWVSPEAVAT